MTPEPSEPTRDINENRRRYYGLRVGDTVQHSDFEGLAKVVQYGILDNNRVQIKLGDGTIIPYVAEWLEIVERVDSPYP